MIRDAFDVTGLTPEQWREQPYVCEIAARRGVWVPATDAVDDDAAAVPAFVNWGDWKVMCPEPSCLGKAEDVWRSWPYTFCMRCGNAALRGRWRPVAFPDDLAEIEACLAVLPRPDQNWHPTERGLGADAPTNPLEDEEAD